MSNNKVPHILPSRHQEDGRFFDYIANIKMVVTSINETDGTAYSWDRLPSSILLNGMSLITYC